MAMVPYNSRTMSQKKKKKTVQASFNPNQLMYDLGLGAVEGAGNLAVRAVRGVVSAFQSRGASKQEIRALVAPLAKSLTYTSRKPKFTRAEGGLSIEHIENIPINTGRNYWMIDTNLFQWLKGIANQFEEYQIQMWFAWNPICPATSTGQVKMAFDYDPQDSVNDYMLATDYFNTADHCVSALWSPAAIAPQRSGWLKTGNNGEARFYSPGRLYLDVTDGNAGYLTVKYQVALRKPQPAPPCSNLTFTGTYSGTTDVFNGAGGFGGFQYLLQSVTANTLVVAPTSGYKIVLWSTDAGPASVVPTITGGGRSLGVRTGTGADFAFLVNPGVAATATAVVTAPGFAVGWKVSIIQTEINPLFFNF